MEATLLTRRQVLPPNLTRNQAASHTLIDVVEVMQHGGYERAPRVQEALLIATFLSSDDDEETTPLPFLS